MKLVVIIPALNEEATVGKVVGAIPKSIPNITEIIPVVVDDGSSDRTAQIAREAGAVVISHSHRKGVGAAFHTGKLHALGVGADIAVNIDGDGQFNPEDIPRVMRPIVQGQADFVTVTRFSDPARQPVMPWIKRWGNSAMTRLVNSLAGTSLTDVSCGMRAYSQEALLRLNLFGSFTYTQEVIISLALSGMRIAEVPAEVRGVREFGKSRVASNLFRYAIQTSKIILRTYRDYRPLRFFSELTLACLVPAVILAVFLLTHYILTGQVSPHKWAALLSVFFFLVAVLFGVTGIMADMNTRIRMNIEEILFHQRRQMLESRKSRRD